jgi:hypothetical protein
VKISDLIYELQSAIDTYGDLTVCTWDGNVKTVDITASLDGDRTFGNTIPNEITLEIIT